MEIALLSAWKSGDAEQFVELARSAEASGFDFLGVADSHSLFRELYTAMGAVAAETESLGVGPMVTNPVTRHPVVSASGMATLCELVPGRAVMGIGTGHSAVDTLGERPARLAEMREVVELLRTLFDGECVEYEGSTVSLDWPPEGGVDVPVYMAAEGPKTQRLAGEVADGVVVNGPHAPLIRQSIDRIRDGAATAGRPDDELDVWVKVRANVADEYDTAVDELEMALADYANVALKSTFDGKDVPNRYHDRLEEFLEEYESHSSYHSTDESNRELLDRLGLTDFFADRYAVAGTPDDCVRQLRELADIDSVDGVLMSTHDQQRFVSRMGEEVLPRLSADGTRS